MEPEIGDVLSAIFRLLPGFLSLWVFQGLTAHPKPSTFDHIVIALILTTAGRVCTDSLNSLLHYLGTWIALGAWTDSTDRAWSLAVALGMGLVMASAAQHDWYHRLIRRLGLNSGSLTSEWFRSFSRYECYVLLHLKDGRRLYGWPKEWPQEPQSGQFVVMEPSWVLDDGTRIDSPSASVYLIAAAAVEMVEFVTTLPDVPPNAGAKEAPRDATPITRPGWDASTD